MTTEKHLHRVWRVTMGKDYKVYKCLDNCKSYFTPVNMLGRTIRCYACKQPFQFEKRNLEQTYPRCLNCAMPKSPVAKARHEKRKAEEVKLSKILSALPVSEVLSNPKVQLKDNLVELGYKEFEAEAIVEGKGDKAEEPVDMDLLKRLLG
jgi:hypothetical protein